VYNKVQSKPIGYIILIRAV